MNFPAWEFHTLLENSWNAKTNSVACLCITLSFGWNLQFSPVRYFARGYPIRLPEVTFGISRARAISLEHKNTMFKYIKTLKCGQTKNIYFTKHDIYFTKLMLILQNINLELKSALRTKYWFYQTLLYCPLQKTPPRLILVFTPPATSYCRRRRRTTHQIFCWIVRHKVKQKLNIIFSFIRAPSHTIWRNWWPWRPVKVRNPSFLLVVIWPNPNWLLLAMTLIIDHVNVGRRWKYKKERNWHSFLHF